MAIQVNVEVGDFSNAKYEVSTDGGKTYSLISGATSATYTTPTLTLADDGTIYRITLKESENYAESDPVYLTIHVRM